MLVRLPGASGTVDIMVTVGAGVSDNVVVTATSSPGHVDQRQRRTHDGGHSAGRDRHITTGYTKCDQRRDASFTIDIENTGNVTDTFDPLSAAMAGRRR